VHNNGINLTRINPVRFLALVIARAGYANRYVYYLGHPLISEQNRPLRGVYYFMKLLLITIAAIMIPHVAHSQTSINDSNWQNHPKMVAIRSIVSEIDSQIRRGAYTTRKAEQEYSEPYKDVLREVFRDGTGTIRKLVRSGGSDDSAVTYNYYYDKEGKLRFVYIQGGAVNGTRIQHRIYFQADGTKIWEKQKLVEGPGYTFPTEWPMEEMVLDPAKLPIEKW
jgi:hypothetical protein